MDLSAYISDRARKVALAAATNTSVDYLYQIATGRRRAGPDLARAIEVATAGAVTRHELRPDLWDAPDQAAA